MKEAVERINLTTVAIERAQRLAAQAEAEKSANKPSVNLTPMETSEVQNGQSEFDRVIEEARIEAGKRFQETLILYSPGATFQDCEDCPKMVVIPAGNFQMGSSTSWFSSTKPPENEQPARNVSVKSFAIGKFEVTQKEWRELMGSSPSKFKGDDLPVEQITFEDAQKFIEKLSIKTGHTYRLPSEAEWEYAALAGQQSEYPSGESVAGLSRLAWFREALPTYKPEPVGTRQGNKFGLFDMYGNVEEWTEDCSNQNYEKAPTNGSPWLEGLCSFRVVRGGAWSHSVKYLRSKSRHQVHQRSKEDNLGFRVVREILN
jgi:formylglycine-generating enzyme required for sulfatase activity